MSDSVVRVALLGGGTVGWQVARLLTDSAEDLQARVELRWSSWPSPCGT